MTLSELNYTLQNLNPAYEDTIILHPEDGILMYALEASTQTIIPSASFGVRFNNGKYNIENLYEKTVPTFRPETPKEIVELAKNSSSQVKLDNNWFSDLLKRSIEYIDRNFPHVYREFVHDMPIIVDTSRDCGTAYMTFNSNRNSHEMHINPEFALELGILNFSQFGDLTESILVSCVFLICHELDHAIRVHVSSGGMSPELAHIPHTFNNILLDSMINTKLSLFMNNAKGHPFIMECGVQNTLSFRTSFIKEEYRGEELFNYFKNWLTTTVKVPNEDRRKEKVKLDKDKKYNIIFCIGEGTHDMFKYESILYTKAIHKFVTDVLGADKIDQQQQQQLSQQSMDEIKKQVEKQQKQQSEEDQNGQQSQQQGGEGQQSSQQGGEGQQSQQQGGESSGQQGGESSEPQSGQQGGSSSQQDGDNSQSNGSPDKSGNVEHPDAMSGQQGGGKSQLQSQDDNTPTPDVNGPDLNKDQSSSQSDSNGQKQSGENQNGQQGDSQSGDGQSSDDDSNDNSNSSSKSGDSQSSSPDGHGGEPLTSRSNMQQKLNDDALINAINEKLNQLNQIADKVQEQAKKEDHLQDSLESIQASNKVKDISQRVKERMEDDDSHSGNPTFEKLNKNMFKGTKFEVSMNTKTDWKKALQKIMLSCAGVKEVWDNNLHSRRLRGAYGTEREDPDIATVGIIMDVSGSMEWSKFKPVCEEIEVVAKLIGKCKVVIAVWNDDSTFKKTNNIKGVSQMCASIFMATHGGGNSESALAECCNVVKKCDVIIHLTDCLYDCEKIQNEYRRIKKKFIWVLPPGFEVGRSWGYLSKLDSMAKKDGRFIQSKKT